MLSFLRPRPHVSGDFCIRNFFYADTKISASTRSVYESYTTVHTYPIRIRTSQRISQQSMRITKKAEPAIILAPNSRLSCLFTWGFNTCELEERKKFLLKNTIKNVSIKRKTEKKPKTTHLFGRTMKYCCFLKWHWITKQQRVWKISIGSRAKPNSDILDQWPMSPSSIEHTTFLLAAVLENLARKKTGSDTVTSAYT